MHGMGMVPMKRRKRDKRSQLFHPISIALTTKVNLIFVYFGIPWMASREYFKVVYNSRDTEKIKNVTR